MLIYASPQARAAVIAAIVAVYLLLSAWEFYRTRDAALMSRWPIVAILLAHAAIFLLRDSACRDWQFAGAEKSPLNWCTWSVCAFEAMLAAFCSRLSARQHGARTDRAEDSSAARWPIR